MVDRVREVAAANMKGETVVAGGAYRKRYSEDALMPAPDAVAAVGAGARDDSQADGLRRPLRHCDGVHLPANDARIQPNLDA